MSEGSRTGVGLALSSRAGGSSCDIECKDVVVLFECGSVGESGDCCGRHCVLGGGLSEMEGGV